jgi:hypothetical protein
VAGADIQYEPVEHKAGVYEHQAFFVREVDGHGELKVHPIIPGAVSLAFKREEITLQYPHLFKKGISQLEVILRPEWPEDRYEIWNRMIVFSGGDLANTLQFGEPPAAMEGLHVISVWWQGTDARLCVSPPRAWWLVMCRETVL